MKIERNQILALSLTLLLSLSTFAIIMPAANAEENGETSGNVEIDPQWRNIWYKFETPLVTLIFPASGKKPMFLWWYTNDNSTIYVVKFKGVIEYLLLDKPYYQRRLNADNDTINAIAWKDYIEPKLRFRYGYGNWGYNWAVNQFLGLLLGLHRAFLPFSACNWTLAPPELVVDGVSSYWSFNFTLTEVYGHPGFQFAENNIQIRCRFYNTTTMETPDETHPEYNYTVAAGQLKFDFVVSHWEWNIDKINQFAKNNEIEIPVNKTGLALWINMASIKLEDISAAENEVQNQYQETVETKSQMQAASINDDYYPVTENQTQNEYERQVRVTSSFRNRTRVQYAKVEGNFSGFLEFVPWARLLDDTGATVDYVNVTASYIAAGGHLRLFICYPYFGNYTLEHDPTIGLASAPLIPMLVTPTLLAILIGATIAIALAVMAVKLRKKPVNMVGVQ
ncbi:hypothetical protein HXY32_00010 [Candidatus Bathyarchaeota archaeon]|nr:hypothetical protein [Candidatus Bathyarchaeota archaeon]